MAVSEIVLSAAINAAHQPEGLIEDIERIVVPTLCDQRAIVVGRSRHVTHDQRGTALAGIIGQRAMDESHVMQGNLSWLEFDVYGVGLIELISIKLEIQHEIISIGGMMSVE